MTAFVNPKTILSHIQNGETFSVVGKYGVDKYKMVIPSSSINGEPFICHLHEGLATKTPRYKEVFEFLCSRKGYYKDAEFILE